MPDNEEILYLLRENNKMLREITAFILHTRLGAEEENVNDFIRNVLANMISNNINNR